MAHKGSRIRSSAGLHNTHNVLDPGYILALGVFQHTVRMLSCVFARLIRVILQKFFHAHLEALERYSRRLGNLRSASRPASILTPHASFITSIVPLLSQTTTRDTLLLRPLMRRRCTPDFCALRLSSLSCGPPR